MNIEENKGLIENEAVETAENSFEGDTINTDSGDGVKVTQKESAGTILKEWIRDIAIAIVIAVLILQFIKPTIVKESSMEPTLYENHYIFLSKQAYTLFGDPQRGDIVVFHSDLTRADGAEKLLIKRVIGLPGDVISIMDGKVYIDGEELEEEYIKDGYTNGYIENLTVPAGYLFCMGDNRLVSIDSRDDRVGCIEESRIVGKAVFRLSPFSLIGPASKWVDDRKEAAEVAGDTDYAQ